MEVEAAYRTLQYKYDQESEARRVSEALHNQLKEQITRSEEKLAKYVKPGVSEGRFRWVYINIEIIRSEEKPQKAPNGLNLRVLAMTCVHFDRAQFCTQVNASF